MSTPERKIIHLVLSKRKDVITESIGEEPVRRIKVKLAAQCFNDFTPSA